MEVHPEGKKKLSLPLLFRIVKGTVWGFIDDSVMRLNASLACVTLFSTIPFPSLLITVGVFFHMGLANQLYVQLQSIVRPEVTGVLHSITESTENIDSSRFAAIISLDISIFGATTTFAEIQSSLNIIQGVKAVPKKSWLKFIENRILSFSVILVLAFILLVTFTIINIIGGLSKKFVINYPEVAGSLVQVVGITINVGVTVTIFALIFEISPNVKIKNRDVFIGAIVTALLLLMGQRGISPYIGVANVRTVYGAVASMVVFAIWICYSSIIIYTGAEFTRAWADEIGDEIFPGEYAVAIRTIEIHENKPIGLDN